MLRRSVVGRMMTRLSPDDHQIVGLLATGMTPQEIGARLGVRTAEIDDRVNDLLIALGFATKADLLFAAALGYI